MNTLNVDSPIGVLSLTSDGEALTGLRFGRSGTDSPDGILRQAERELHEYFAGRRTAFDVPLKPHGTPFQLKVWSELARIPYGETKTYGQIAALIGAPKAARAVGMANNRNPIAVFIPCHRVIGANGSLTGYAGGLDKKELRLSLERK